MTLRRMLIIAFTVRIAIAPFVAHPADIMIWFNWTQDFLHGRFDGLFAPPYLLAYVLAPFALLYGALHGMLHDVPFPISAIPESLRPAAVWQVTYVPGFLFDLIIKIPFITSDILAGFVIYKIVELMTEKKSIALNAIFLWLFNPLTLWVSAGWGMFDALPTLFTLLSVYLILRRNTVFSGFSLAVAFALKLYAAVIAVPLLIYLRNDANNRPNHRLLYEFLAGLGIAVAAFYFLDWNQTLNFIAGFLTTPGFPFPNSGPAGYGLTYWSLSLIWPLEGVNTLVPLVATAALLIAVYWLYAKRSLDHDPVNLISAVSASMVAIFLTFRLVAENWIVWIVPFIAVLVAVGRVERSLFWFITSLAFLFAIANSLLPFYLLPDQQWIGGFLQAVLAMVTLYRIMPGGVFVPGPSVGTVIIASLGVAFSASLVVLLLETTIFPGKPIIRWFTSRISNALARI